MFDNKEQSQTQRAGEGSTQYQAGRDIVINNLPGGDKIDVMRRLVECYNKEKNEGGNTEFSGYIRKLEKFTTKVDGELSNLEQKLIEGGYRNDVDWAIELKEDYAKLLQQNKFSMATQHIHAYLLAWVMTYFKQFVVDAIRSGKSQQDVKQIISEKVIAQVEHIIGGENNVLEVYSDDINGMIYYLTGNCHLKWI